MVEDVIQPATLDEALYFTDMFADTANNYASELGACTVRFIYSSSMGLDTEHIGTILADVVKLSYLQFVCEWLDTSRRHTNDIPAIIIAMRETIHKQAHWLADEVLRLYKAQRSIE